MSKGRILEDRATLAVMAVFIIPALIGIVVFAGPIVMKGCGRDSTDAAHGAPSTVVTSSVSAVPRTPSARLCYEGNACAPDSTGPFDGFCMSSKDASTKLVCKGGRLVRSDSK